MSIIEVIENLKKSNLQGLQIQKRFGILTSTWLIYLVKSKIYFFDINEKIEFIEKNCYTETELDKMFNNGDFLIEESVN